MDPALSALVATLQTLIAAAQSEGTAPGATSTQYAAMQEIVTHAQGVITLLGITGTTTPTKTVIVHENSFGAQSIFEIAQNELGDMLRYRDIQALNGLSFIALQAGQILRVPLS